MTQTPVAEATALDLDAIRRREEAATKAPWRAGERSESGVDQWRIPIEYDLPVDEGETVPDTLAVVEYQTGGFQFPHHDAEADAAFIAAAREDVPALLGAVDALRDCLAELLRVHDTADGWPEHTAAFDRAREVLATVTPTTGGAR